MCQPICLFVSFNQIFECYLIALDTCTTDRLFTIHAGIGYLPKGFSLGHIRDVYLHGRNADGFQRVQNGDAGVGIGGRIDDDAIIFAVRTLNLIHETTFVIALKMVDRDVHLLGAILQ